MRRGITCRSSIGPSWGGSSKFRRLIVQDLDLVTRRLFSFVGDGGATQHVKQLVQSLLALAGLVLGCGWVQLETCGLAGLARDEDRRIGSKGARLARGGGSGGHDCWEEVSRVRVKSF